MLLFIFIIFFKIDDDYITRHLKPFIRIIIINKKEIENCIPINLQYFQKIQKIFLGKKK
jgi:hypothetical protein